MRSPILLVGSSPAFGQAFLTRNIGLMRYERPTPIQKHAIPLALGGGHDLMCCAQTGARPGLRPLHVLYSSIKAVITGRFRTGLADAGAACRLGQDLRVPAACLRCARRQGRELTMGGTVI